MEYKYLEYVSSADKPMDSILSELSQDGILTDSGMETGWRIHSVRFPWPQSAVFGVLLERAVPKRGAA